MIEVSVIAILIILVVAVGIAYWLRRNQLKNIKKVLTDRHVSISKAVSNHSNSAQQTQRGSSIRGGY